MRKVSILLLLAGMIAVFAGCSNSSENAKSASADVLTSTAAIKMGRGEYAAHGTKCFTVAVVAVQGDKIVGASLDDYQFLDKAVAQGVPNSDADFGANYKDPNMVLASKKVNAAYYSEHMKEAANATTPVDKSLSSIEQYVTGKTISELENELSKKSAEQMVDAVSGATLVDTKNYINALVEAAKTAK